MMNGPLGSRAALNLCADAFKRTVSKVPGQLKKIPEASVSSWGTAVRPQASIGKANARSAVSPPLTYRVAP